MGRNSRNSHKPPWSDGYGKPAPRSRRERSGREPGGQPGHPGSTLAQASDPDERVTHAPSSCRACGGRLSARRSPRPSVGRCSTCHRSGCTPSSMCSSTGPVAAGRRRWPPRPPGWARPPSTGRGCGRWAATCSPPSTCRWHGPRSCCPRCCRPVSEGSLAAWYADAATGLDPFCETVKTGLGGAGVLGVDETGIRVDGRLAWLHAARTDSLTYYSVSAKRGEQAMTEAGVLPKLGRGQVLVHDCWAPYWRFDVTQVQRCGPACRDAPRTSARHGITEHLPAEQARRAAARCRQSNRHRRIPPRTRRH